MRRWRLVTASALALLIGADPAAAGPLAAAVAPLVSAAAGAPLAGALGSAALRIGASLALSALSRALRDEPPSPGASRRVEIGGDRPMHVILGVYADAGHLIYAGSHGRIGATPNAYCTEVVVLSAVPGLALRKVIVNGAYCTLGTVEHPDGYGLPVLEYRDTDGTDYLWIRFYGSGRTTPDPMLRARYGADPVWPWSEDMVGRGLAWAIMTARFSDGDIHRGGVPKIVYEVDGIPLYDRRRDSTAGGSGGQRRDQPATWLPSTNPFVAIDTILGPGLSAEGQHLYGPRLPPRSLPGASLVAAMNACDEMVAEAGGASNRRWRLGARIDLAREPGEVVREILKGAAADSAHCEGRFLWHCGAAKPAVLQVTDADCSIDHPQELDPFRPVETAFNAATATYPDPASGWATMPATPRFYPSLESQDGGRRQVAALQFPWVPWHAQVQRLMHAAILDERRERTHQLVLPPRFAAVEPVEDYLAWTSARNGYVAKLFKVSEVVDLPTGWVALTLVEEDPADYDWQPSDELPPRPVPLAAAPRPALAVPGWWVEPVALTDAGGTGRRPAFRLHWQAEGLEGVTGIKWRRRIQGQTAQIAGSVAGIEAEQATVAEGILPGATYEWSARLIAPRITTSWTPWTAATAPDLRITEADLDPTYTQALGLTSAAMAAAQAASQAARADAQAAAAAAAQGAAEAGTILGQTTAARDQTQAFRDAALAAETAAGTAAANAAAARTAAQAARDQTQAFRDATQAAQALVEGITRDLLPADFRDGGKWWTDSASQAPDVEDTTWTGWTFPTVAGRRVASIDLPQAGVRFLLARGLVPATPGRVWRVAAELEMTQAPSPTTRVVLWGAWVNEDGSAPVGVTLGVRSLAAAAQTVSAELTVPAAPARPRLRLGLHLPDDFDDAGTVRILSLRIEDVSSEVAAAGFASTATTKATEADSRATAAAGFAAAAQTHRDTAQGHAGAAASSALSAASQAGAAESSAAAAEAARLAAQTARSGAESARDAAVTARQTADSAAATATTQAGNAANAATQAGQSAAAANSSATSAQASATAAGQSASTATTQANTATTRAGEAATSASQAATSASTATSASNSATATEQVVARTARDLLPSGFEQDGKFWTNEDARSPDTPETTLSPWTFGSSPEGRVARLTLPQTGLQRLGTLGLLRAEPGRVLRLTVRARTTAAISATTRLYLRFLGLHTDFTSPVEHSGAMLSFAAQGAWQVFTRDHTVPAAPPRALIRPQLYVPDDFNDPGDVEVVSVLVQDVTSEVAAGGSAAAAATSASTAATHSTSAATSASSATSAANTAQSARDTAESHASAAATSASSAATQSTSAGASAAAAEAARLAAQAAQAGASLARDEAVTARNTAQTSAATATAQATLAAEARFDADRVARDLLPADFRDGGKWWTDSASQAPAVEDTSWTGWTFPTVAGRRVASIDLPQAGVRFLLARGLVPATPGRIYRVTAELEMTQAPSATTRLVLWGAWVNEDGSAPVGVTLGVRSLAAAAQTVSAELTVPAAPARPRLRLGLHLPDDFDDAGTVRILSLRIEDVTESRAAASSASAALLSEQAASAAATAAGQSASAANSDRLLAEAARAGSETARSQAVTAQTNAQAAATSASDTLALTSSLTSRGLGLLSDQYLDAYPAGWTTHGAAPAILAANLAYPVGNSLEWVTGAADTRGLIARSDHPVWPGPDRETAYRIEVEFDLVAGSLSGAGLQLVWLAADATSHSVAWDLAGVARGEGTRRRASVLGLRPASFAGKTHSRVEAWLWVNSSSWGGFAAKTLRLHRFQVLAASDEELGRGAVAAEVAVNHYTKAESDQTTATIQSQITATLTSANAHADSRDVVLAQADSALAARLGRLQADIDTRSFTRRFDFAGSDLDGLALGDGAPALGWTTSTSARLTEKRVARLTIAAGQTVAGLRYGLPEPGFRHRVLRVQGVAFGVTAGITVRADALRQLSKADPTHHGAVLGQHRDLPTASWTDFALDIAVPDEDRPVYALRLVALGAANQEVRYGDIVVSDVTDDVRIRATLTQDYVTTATLSQTLATYDLGLNATFAATRADVQQTMTALASVQGNLSATYALRLRAGGAGASFEMVALDSAGGPALSSVIFDADWFTVRGGMAVFESSLGIVGTLEIAGRAVTVPLRRNVKRARRISSTANWVVLADLAIPRTAGLVTDLSASFDVAGFGEGVLQLAFFRGATQVSPARYHATAAGGRQTQAVLHWVDSDQGAGNATYSLRARKAAASVTGGWNADLEVVAVAFSVQQNKR